jgi:hypothetical protein
MINDETARRCRLEEKELGHVVNTESDKPFTWDDPCVERGVMVGHNAKAHAGAVNAVGSLLKRLFNLQ